MLLWALWGQFILRESVLRQVDKESRGPQGERGLEFQGGRKDKLFFLSLHSLGLYNNKVSCLRTVSGLRTVGEGNGTPLQYSCLENPMDGGAWKTAVHGVAKSWARQSDFTFTFHFHALEKEMATHSSVLAWRIPGTGEPGGLPSMGSHRVRHD